MNYKIMQASHNYPFVCTTLILLTLTLVVRGDYEHQCQVSDYTNHERRWPGRLSVCVSGVADFITKRCGHDAVDVLPGYSKNIYQRDSGVFVDASMAMTMLRLRTENADSYIGLDCECCHHRCSPNEFDQYCKYSSPRRRRRRSAANVFNEKEIKSLYNKIQMTHTIDLDQLPIFPIENLDQIRKTKTKNIRQRMLSDIFGWSISDEGQNEGEGRHDLGHASRSKVLLSPLEKQQHHQIPAKAPPLSKVTSSAISSKGITDSTLRPVMHNDFTTISENVNNLPS